ncbi:TPA: hypothetical protein RPW15_001497 [Campylobacter fetus subsp. venerealis]|nr:hypothetical protein [Campylobacter fetus subsp. venerealis]HDX6283690.1 hypothetical protein [Campylobacter fetus subsp. venerealis]HDX6285831.1 hypothetical protein [Campylobacter fetus subsp. venerealis]HDX6287795.1 hypothetical protein [Campylobacter fetus subsp. venerealis]HDX6289589.1 hypothetical protein [Campylobacter fetus subsp. venerealis]
MKKEVKLLEYKKPKSKPKIDLDEPCFIVLDEIGLFIPINMQRILHNREQKRLRRQDRQIRARLQKLWGEKI